MDIKRAIFTFLAAGLISFSGFSQQVDKARLDAYFDTLANNNRFMGKVAISHNGELLYTKTVGFIDIEQELKADENSKYRIASVSKAFTAVLVFQAIEENKLKLNQTIDKFFPDIKNAKQITVSNLLNHRSGLLPDILNDNSFDWGQPRTEQEMIEIISKAGSEYKPGKKARYSNTSFVVLTYILEKIYQKPYSEILEEKIVRPIGLKNTYFGKKINTEDNESKSYRHYSWVLQFETDMSALTGAAGVVSTADDLTRFSDALFTGKLISTNSLEKMKSLKDNYGMGLFPFSFDGKTGFGHMGDRDGFKAFFAYFPDSKVSIAFTANGLYRINIASVLLSAIYNKPFEIPEFKTYNVANEDLNIYTGVYTSKQHPLILTISKVNNMLIAQVTEKTDDTAPLEPIDKDIFAVEGIIFEFNPTDKTVVAKASDGTFNFVRND